MQTQKRYKVWIHDYESGCEQPIECIARSEQEAKAAGKRYIKIWGLRGASITKIKLEVKNND